MPPQIRFDFVGKLDGKTVLGDGSVRYQARLTRVGVFDYGDHKELRHEDEVFKQASIDSFKGITVTEGHRAFVDPANWKSIAIGHVGDDVRRDGDHLAASITLKDKDAIAKADRGELVELSMGYTVNLDATPGQTASGEKYDAIQTDIVGNHAAMGPRDWGRAGASVRLLDGAAYAPGDMTTPVQRTDAPINTDAADLVAARADAEAVRKERDAARADLAAANKRADNAEAERDAAKKTAADAETARKTDASKADAAIEARIALLDSARGVLGAEFVFAGKSDKDIRVAAIMKADPSAKLDGKSDGYLERSFEIACESVKTDRAALGAVNETTTNPKESAPVKSRLDEAEAKRDAERAEQAKGGVPKGAMVRK